MTIDGASISKAQVVLITASEFLREEEKDEKQDSEKENPANGNIEANIQFEDEAKSTGAWTMNRCKTSFMPMLAVN